MIQMPRLDPLLSNLPLIASYAILPAFSRRITFHRCTPFFSSFPRPSLCSPLCNPTRLLKTDNFAQEATPPEPHPELAPGQTSSQ